jgi:EPS-associated MarR family transcriptional regulator
MSEKQDSQEKLDVLSKIKKNPETSQRKLANELGFSLGKLNYLLNAFMEKGLVKIKNFKKNPKKTNYLYILTKKGLTEKTKLTVHFMERKMKEYDELKKEISKEGL